MPRNARPSSSRGPSDAAIDWWTRIDAGGLSHSEEADFKAWLAKDAANQAAFDETCALWGDLKGLSSLSPLKQRGKRAKKLTAITALAAALVLALNFDELKIRARADILTGTGEIKTITLEDGSRIELDAETAIATNYSATQRRVNLLKGEAWFEVAPNRARPFTVEAAEGKITALGTSFNVATAREKTEVTVTEHSVSVEASGQTVNVNAGEQTAYGPGFSASAARPADAESATAWRRGTLIFEDRPLAEVVALIDRYHRGYCLIIDSSIRNRLVTGVFRSSDPLQAIRTLERSLGLRAIHLTDYLVLLRG